jgi:hypothetical protein
VLDAYSAPNDVVRLDFIGCAIRQAMIHPDVLI